MFKFVPGRTVFVGEGKRIPFSLLEIGELGRYNGLYGAGNALDMLLAMCDGGRYAPTPAAQLRSRWERGRGIPMPQWLPCRLRRAVRAATEGRARGMIGFIVRALQEEGRLRRPVTVAVDKILIPFYGSHEDMAGRIHLKHCRGTRAFRTHATAVRRRPVQDPAGGPPGGKGGVPVQNRA